MRQTTEGSEPIRSCVGCRERRPQSALVRITRDASGLVIDGPSAGRGAWICRSLGASTAVDRACLGAAVGRHGLDRAWRTTLGAEERAALRDAIAQWGDPQGAADEGTIGADVADR